MKCFVTGAAGFIGSHLCRRLLAEGAEVVGIDSFTDYYPRPVKEARVATLADQPGFTFVEGDVLTADLDELATGSDFIFHQAAQAGVRASWGQTFKIYTNNNVLATQRMLECARRVRPRKFVYASSSSVYGEGRERPTKENDPKVPLSPYGVTKLAGEHLCHLYEHNFGVPTISLRYFTVYGPLGRPDMSIWKFTLAMLRGEELTVYGDGEQSRGFTYISDVVEANLLAARSKLSDTAFNVGGASTVTVNQLIRQIERILGKKARVRHEEFAKGDARHTEADMSRTRKLLGLTARTPLSKGLPPTIQSIRDFYGL
ncbi:MAG TPA: NAD-dependent epimerase/dehydratase family protein [Planctomycetota bacterium]|nr:NAD-dependent epimerase/dehydratase family protein [Planctomycetota bacterium]HRR80818.1 NAD-dependent epimerase/dehydratase family protein [Planctomycetota bacterium]HRT96432.1 NAD-dependent epimerase/dehydratase family protein [Planctomycetota bacterium]